MGVNLAGPELRLSESKIPEPVGISLAAPEPHTGDIGPAKPVGVSLDVSELQWASVLHTLSSVTTMVNLPTL